MENKCVFSVEKATVQIIKLRYVKFNKILSLPLFVFKKLLSINQIIKIKKLLSNNFYKTYIKTLFTRWVEVL